MTSVSAGHSSDEDFHWLTRHGETRARRGDVGTVWATEGVLPRKDPISAPAPLKVDVDPRR